MKSLAANLLRSAADAEDAVQDCFVKVFRGAAAFRGSARFSTWIYRILVNTCYDAMRRRGRQPEPRGPEEAVSDDAFGGATPPVDHPLRLDLEESVAALPEKPKTVFLLNAVEGFSHGEIADILGIPEATSRTLLFEARRALQRRLWRAEVRA
jgi:RNA polymerase sigma-70 factor (ECF subfamily)